MVTPDAVSPHAAVQRRILAVLSVTQVLAGVGMATALAVSTLVAARLSGSELIGGAALTCVVLGAAGAALVVARVATRRGRRPALGLGYGVGAFGAAMAALGVGAGSSTVMLVGLLLAGAATAAGLAARFAATDLAEPDRRARALALVVWSTTVGAIAGPNLAGPVQTLAGAVGLVPATGPFWMCAVAFGLAAAGTWWGLRPDPLLLARGTAEGPSGGRLNARAALLSSPAALLGAGGVVLGHLVMIALMSMAPVHLDHGGASLSVVGLVISAHVAGMYAFSPVLRLAGRPPRSNSSARAGRPGCSSRPPGCARPPAPSKPNWSASGSCCSGWAGPLRSWPDPRWSRTRCRSRSGRRPRAWSTSR